MAEFVMMEHNNSQIDRINGAAKAAFEITERRILQMQHELKRDVSTMMQQITAKLDERHNQLAGQLNNIERQVNRMMEGLETSGLITPGPPPVPPPGPPMGAPTRTAQPPTPSASRQPPMTAVAVAGAPTPRQPPNAPPTLQVPNSHRQPQQQQPPQQPHFYPPPPNAAAMAAAAARRVANTKQPPQQQPPQQQPPPDWRDPRTMQPVVGPLGAPPPAAAAAGGQPPHAPNIPLFPKSVQDLLREHEVLCLEQWKDSNKSHWKSGLPMNYSRRRYVYNKICERAQLLKGNALNPDEKRQKAAEIMDMEMREKGLSSVYQYLNHLRSLDGTIKRRKRK